jgi:hypothetical protein
MAAEAGIAPPVRYASVADGVLILDFVERKPFPADLALRIAPIIRQIHALPGFPGGVNYLDTLDGFVRRFQAANLLPGSETEELLRGYATIAGVYPRDGAGLVASHNDLNPRNILFDGARVWIVDWEAAFLNDRYVDLAVVANFFVGDEAEDAYLSAYFGEPVDDYRRSRFFVMRQAVHVFYVTLLLLSAAASGVPIGADLTAGDFKEFHRREFANALSELLPRSLIPVIIHLSGIPPHTYVHQITREQRLGLVRLLKHLKLTVKKARGFYEAVVTAGGVSTREIDAGTMQSRLVRGLYFTGEVIDVDAYTGGYNLQIAWSTGHLAGMSV